MTLDAQVLRISLARLASLGHELKLKHGKIRLAPADGAPTSPLVTIRAGAPGSRAPVFLVHPVGGSVLAYYELANHLAPDQPVYAIENQILFRPEVPRYTTLEATAEQYLREVRRAQPTGPVFLGGYSMGGAVAFEMARQALDAGREVGLVAIIDTPARLRDLGAPAPEQVSARELVVIVRMLAARQDQQVALSEEELAPIPPERRLDHIVETLKAAGVLASHADAPLLQTLLGVVRNNELAQRSYVPRRFAGDLVLLKSMAVSPELRAEAPDVYDDASFGWQAVCERRVVVEHVPGEHFKILNRPHVRDVGAVLQRHLDQRQRERTIAPF